MISWIQRARPLLATFGILCKWWASHGKPWPCLSCTNLRLRVLCALNEALVEKEARSEDDSHLSRLVPVSKLFDLAISLASHRRSALSCSILHSAQSIGQSEAHVYSPTALSSSPPFACFAALRISLANTLNSFERMGKQPVATTHVNEAVPSPPAPS